MTQLAGLRRRSRNSAAAAFDFRGAEAKLRWRQRGSDASHQDRGPSPHRRDRCSDDQDRGERPQPMPWPSTAYGGVRTRAPSTIAAANAGSATGAAPFLGSARPITDASNCVRPAVRASAKAASTVLENIAGVSRIHAPRAIAGAATPATPSSPPPRHRRVAIRLTGRAVHAGERTRHRDRAQIALTYSPPGCATRHA